MNKTINIIVDDIQRVSKDEQLKAPSNSLQNAANMTYAMNPVPPSSDVSGSRPYPEHRLMHCANQIGPGIIGYQHIATRHFTDPDNALCLVK